MAGIFDLWKGIKGLIGDGAQPFHIPNSIGEVLDKLEEVPVMGATVATLRNGDTYVDLAYTAPGIPVEIITSIIESYNPLGGIPTPDNLKNIASVWNTLAALQSPDESLSYNQNAYIANPQTNEPEAVSNDVGLNDPKTLNAKNHSDFAMYVLNNLVGSDGVPDKPIVFAQNDVRTEFRQETQTMQQEQSAGWDMLNKIFKEYAEISGKPPEDFNFIYLHCIDKSGTISEGFANISLRYDEIMSHTSIADSKYINASSYMMADAMSASLVQYTGEKDSSGNPIPNTTSDGDVILRPDMESIMSTFNFNSFSRSCLKTDDAFRVLHAMLKGEEPYNDPAYVIADPETGKYRSMNDDEIKELFSHAKIMHVAPAAPAIDREAEPWMPPRTVFLNPNDLILRATGLDFAAYEQDNGVDKVFLTPFSPEGELLGHGDKPYLEYISSLSSNIASALNLGSQAGDEVSMPTTTQFNAISEHLGIMDIGHEGTIATQPAQMAISSRPRSNNSLI